MPQTTLTTLDIYQIRYLGRERRLSAAQIKAALGLTVGLETIRRVIRGETHAGIGVGAAELANHSNRLADAPRGTGEAKQSYVDYAQQAREAEAAVLVEREKRAREQAERKGANAQAAEAMINEMANAALPKILAGIAEKPASKPAPELPKDVAERMAGMRGERRPRAEYGEPPIFDDLSDGEAEKAVLKLAEDVKLARDEKNAQA